MSRERIVVHGERYLELEVVASCYAVEVEWLREVYALGVLGAGVERGESVAIASRALDRVATVVRLHVHHELDLDAIVLFFGTSGPEL